MSERIQLVNPDAGKQGARIEREKYDRIRTAIRAVLQANPGITFTDLMRSVPGALAEPFDGSPSWYTTAVKLDMEARGEIRRVPGSRPQRLELV